MIKRVVLLVVVLLLAIFFWGSAGKWIGDPVHFYQLSAWRWPLLAFVLYLTGFALAILLLTPWRYQLALGVINLAVFFFFFGFHQLSLVGALIAILFQIWSRHQIQFEGQNRLRFSIVSVINSGLPRLIVSFLILLSLGYYLNGDIQSLSQKRELPSTAKQVVQVVVGSVFKAEVEKDPGLARNLTNVVWAETNKLLLPFFHFLPPLVALGLFLLLYGLSSIFLWLTVGLSWIVWRLLKYAGLVKITVEERAADTVNF